MMNEYDARVDSLLSEQDFQKIELYFTVSQIQAESIFLEIYIQETNQPRKKLKQTKPQVKHEGKTLQFPQSQVIQYFFEIRQRIIVEVVNAQASYRQVLGVVEATVGEIVNGRQAGAKKDIVQGNTSKLGVMILRSEKVQTGNSKFVEWTLTARNIDTGSAFLCFGEAGAQWKLYKIKKNNEYLLYESQIKQGKNNTFEHHKISEKKLCNNDYKQPIIIRFYSDSGSNIGEAKFDLATLHEGKKRFTIMKKSKEKGTISLQNFKQTVKFDFMDYLTNGMQMAMVVAIDFTASNGLQTAPSSLHYVNNNHRSQYEQALYETCNIVLDYDTDKLVPCFGFGAKVNIPGFNTNGKVHHCFPINGSEQNPNLFQLQGILQGYRRCLPYISFAGPTFFAPLLRQAMGVCEIMRKETKEYLILLIMTDGIIHDKEEVKDLLVKCSRLPLSIIIIGIGEGENQWRAMHQLDDDDCLMTDKQGNRTERDLVQFVEFRKHNNNGVNLAKEVLEELPRQVEEYHELIGLPPEAYRKNLAQIQYQQNQL